MAAPKAQTLQQRFGFADKDLTTPKHDEIMLWLDQNIVTVIGHILNHSKRWKQIAEGREWSHGDTEWEMPVISRSGYGNQYIIGFVDLATLVSVGSDQRYFMFEVKSSIPSLGEVIRQIRMYETYSRGAYVIVSPDDRFADALRAQGIEFYKCPGAVADIWDSVS